MTKRTRVLRMLYAYAKTNHPCKWWEIVDCSCETRYVHGHKESEQMQEIRPPDDILSHIYYIPDYQSCQGKHKIIIVVFVFVSSLL
jgi:hypothetical protein